MTPRNTQPSGQYDFFKKVLPGNVWIDQAQKKQFNQYGFSVY